MKKLLSALLISLALISNVGAQTTAVTRPLQGGTGIANANTETITLDGALSFGANITAFINTPTSANLAAAVTNETGSGALVFGTSPTFTTGVTMSFLTAGRVPFAGTAGLLGDNANLTYDSVTNYLQVGTGTTTSVAGLIGYSGTSGYGRLWLGAAVNAPTSSNYAVTGNATETYLNSAGSVFINAGATQKALYVATAGAGPLITAGTATSAVSAHAITQTWNFNTSAIQGVDWTFTDTSSHANTNAFRIRGGAGGATNLFIVDKSGNLTGVGTNLTGTAASLTAGLATDTVTKTGTGSTYATSASPTFTGTVTAAAITASGSVSTGALSATTGTFSSTITSTDIGGIFSAVVSNAGVITPIMSNTNAGASSGMQFTVRSTGGDPSYALGISGITNWIMGIDNSDSQAFVVANSLTPGSSNYLKITTGGAVTIPGTLGVTGAVTMSGTASIGGGALTLTTGALGLSKMTASASAPGAAGTKLEAVCGTNAGSAKLVMYAGTSGTAVTIVDNVGTGVTGC